MGLYHSYIDVIEFIYTGNISYNGYFLIPYLFPYAYHSNYLAYTSLSYIGTLVPLNFSDIPKQLIFLSYTIFSTIMDCSQWLQCVHMQRVESSDIRLDM